MTIIFEICEPNIAQITINRPQTLNAFNWEAMDAFANAITEAQSVPDIHVLIITGAGDRAFCAGGDLRELQPATTEADGWRVTSGMTKTLAQLEALPYPTIAAINGLARGGGLELTLACDLRIAAENTTLGFTQVRLGLTPGWGSGQRLLHLVGYPKALELLATGRIFTPAEALSFGLVDQVVPQNEVLPRARALARLIAANEPTAVRANKAILRAGQQLPPSAASQIEQEVFPPLWAAEAHHQRVNQFFNQREKP